MKLNLNQITIEVREIEKSISFYEKLGLKLIVKDLPKYARFECPAGDSTFSLHQLTGKGNTGSAAWIYFESQQLDEDVEKLLQEGVTFESLPSDQPWLWREATLSDPDGYKIILYHAGQHRKNPPWRIS